MTNQNGDLQPYRAAPVGQVAGETLYAVFQGDEMVSGRVMTQDEAKAEADRMNAAAFNRENR